MSERWAAESATTCTFVLAALAASTAVARSRTHAWLDAIRCPQPLADDIVYAINEALSNAIEHAHPEPDAAGVIRVTLHAVPTPAGGRRVRAEIRNHGPWRPPRPGHDHRGRGIPLMQALTDELTVHRVDDDGVPATEVVLTSAEFTPRANPMGARDRSCKR